MNKNVVRSRPPSGSPEGSIVRVKGPGHNIRKTQGENMGTRGHCVSAQVTSEGLCEIAKMTVFKFGFPVINSVMHNHTSSLSLCDECHPVWFTAWSLTAWLFVWRAVGKKEEAENYFSAADMCVGGGVRVRVYVRVRECEGVGFSTIASTSPGSSVRPTPRQYTHIIPPFDVAKLPQNPDVTENTNQNSMQSGPRPGLTYYFVY